PSVAIGFEVTDLTGFTKALGSEMAGLLGAADFVPLSNDVPANQQYRAEMKSAGYTDLGGFRQDAWLAVHVFADLAAGMPAVTAPALFDLLNHTSGLKTGLTPPLQWVTGGVGGVPRVFNGCEMEVAYDKAGVATAVSGTFVDPFTNAPCPSP
ncbi:MAG TPA: hypothetical protein VMU14_05845, partial [Acidimicrobiales bacterium]|nr:hypothetical protein [Acidimicrobiales bacterium]